MSSSLWLTANILSISVMMMWSDIITRGDDSFDGQVNLKLSRPQKCYGFQLEDQSPGYPGIDPLNYVQVRQYFPDFTSPRLRRLSVSLWVRIPVLLVGNEVALLSFWRAHLILYVSRQPAHAPTLTTPEKPVTPDLGGSDGFIDVIYVAVGEATVHAEVGVLADGAWHLVTVTVESAACFACIYVDGALISSPQCLAPSPPGACRDQAPPVGPTAQLALGHSNPEQPEYAYDSLLGDVFGVEIHGYELSPEQVSAMFRECSIPPGDMVSWGQGGGGGRKFDIPDGSPVKQVEFSHRCCYRYLASPACVHGEDH